MLIVIPILSLDERYLCVGTSSGSVLVFNLITGKLIAELNHRRSMKSVKCCLFSRDYKWAVGLTSKVVHYFIVLPELILHHHSCLLDLSWRPEKMLIYGDLTTSAMRHWRNGRIGRPIDVDGPSVYAEVEHWNKITNNESNRIMTDRQKGWSWK